MGRKRTQTGKVDSVNEKPVVMTEVDRSEEESVVVLEANQGEEESLVVAEADPIKGEPVAISEETPSKETDNESEVNEPAVSQNYKIICCNLINESFGGVTFHNGIAHTNDSYTASWFRNKGYTVIRE